MRGSVDFLLVDYVCGIHIGTWILNVPYFASLENYYHPEFFDSPSDCFVSHVLTFLKNQQRNSFLLMSVTLLYFNSYVGFEVE